MVVMLEEWWCDCGVYVFMCSIVWYSVVWYVYYLIMNYYNNMITIYIYANDVHDIISS